MNFQKGWYKDSAFFISDFYFPATKTTIELDGSSHSLKKQQIQDKSNE
jgi:very-short-patch-repair endonuclease